MKCRKESFRRWRDLLREAADLHAVFVGAALALLLLLFAGCSSSSSRHDTTHASAYPHRFCDRHRPIAHSASGEAVRLNLDRRQFTPGEELYYRIINERAHAVAYGFRPYIEAFRNGRWRNLVIERGGSLLAFAGPAVVLVGSPAGSACGVVPLSPEWTPGRYRLRQRVTARFDSGRHERLNLVTEFRLGSVR